MKKIIIAILICLFPVLAFAGLQEDLNAFSASGGGVYNLQLKTYMIYAKLVIPANVSPIGQGYPGAFEELSSTNVTCIKAGFPLATLVETAPGWSGILGNLYLHGNWRTDTCLSMKAPQGGTIRRVYIAHSGTRGIFLQSTPDAQAVRNKFDQVNIADTYIALDMIGADNKPNTLNTFEDCRFQGQYESVRIEQWTDTNLWQACRIEVPEGGYGIAIEGHPEIGNNIFAYSPIEGYGTGIIVVGVDGSSYCSKYPNRIIHTLWGGNLIQKVLEIGPACLSIE